MSNEAWLYIGIFLVIAPLLGGAAILIPAIIGPKRPGRIKSDTYECGMETVGESWIQFKVQYYIYALVFLVFDVELVFLFPWAAAFNQLPLFAVVEGVIFVLILVVGLAYAWRKGVLEWV